MHGLQKGTNKEETCFKMLVSSDDFHAHRFVQTAKYTLTQTDILHLLNFTTHTLEY